MTSCSDYHSTCSRCHGHHQRCFDASGHRECLEDEHLEGHEGPHPFPFLASFQTTSDVGSTSQLSWVVSTITMAVAQKFLHAEICSFLSWLSSLLISPSAYLLCDTAGVPFFTLVGQTVGTAINVRFRLTTTLSSSFDSARSLDFLLRSAPSSLLLLPPPPSTLSPPDAPMLQLPVLTSFPEQIQVKKKALVARAQAQAKKDAAESLEHKAQEEIEKREE